MKKQRRRSTLYKYSELIRMSDGSFYTRRSPMPVAQYYDDALEQLFPSSLNYEFDKQLKKKDSLQNRAFQPWKEGDLAEKKNEKKK